VNERAGPQYRNAAAKVMLRRQRHILPEPNPRSRSSRPERQPCNLAAKPARALSNAAIARHASGDGAPGKWLRIGARAEQILPAGPHCSPAGITAIRRAARCAAPATARALCRHPAKPPSRRCRGERYLVLARIRGGRAAFCANTGAPREVAISTAVVNDRTSTMITASYP